MCQHQQRGGYPPESCVNHDPVKMYPKDHIRKVFIDVIILLLILVITCFICVIQKICASRASV